MAYDRQWLIDMLRRLGYPQAAEEAERVLPAEFSYQELREFADKQGVSLTELTDRMGGSP